MKTIATDLAGRIEAILPRVEKPHRYLGNELNVVRKPDADVDLRVALVFPEVYEIGMSWPGQQILYALLNDQPGLQAERAYAFWPDMEAAMREADMPAFSLESWTPLREFDIVGITLQHELVFTNILATLDLAGIPLRSADRGPDAPLVIAGGPVAFNPEPVADFLDAIALGDGEDVFLQICEVVRAWKRDGAPRADLLARLARLEGVYVPSFYEIEYNETVVSGWSMPAVRAIRPRDGVRPVVRRRFVEDLNRIPFPERPIVPLGDTVHNRLGVEVQRGCTRACRFCQAGYIYRPERQRSPENVRRIVERSLRATGHDEVSFLSLSIGDYGCLESLMADLLGDSPRATNNLSVSLPSIRVDTLIEPVVDRIASARKTGFTMAPEAGSPRLRDVINKALSEEQIARAAEMVFQRGWSHIKFYYIIGLPTETDDDVLGIARTARMCREIGRRFTRKADIVVSTSTFVPKPFTPFQWEPQIAREEILRRQRLLRDELERSGITYKWHESRESFLEAVLSRGDRRLGAAVEAAFRRGARFDGWKEHFREETWRAAFDDAGIEPEFYALRRVPLDETLPWDMIDCGVTKEWFIKDYLNGVQAKFVPDCATGRCYMCGVCDFEVVKNRTYLSAETGHIPQGVAARGKGAHPEIITARASNLERDAQDTGNHGQDAHATGNLGRDVRAAGERAPDVHDVHDVHSVQAAEGASGVSRLRIRFAKTGRAAWLGHLDLMEILARAFKRAGVRLDYSKGFHPMPKLAFGPALMTGATSECEYMDADALEPLPDGDLAALVNAGLPDGLRLLAVSPREPGARSLGATISGFVYEVDERRPGALPDADALRVAVERFLAAPAVEIETPRKTYDVRPFVENAAAVEGRLRVSLAIGEGGRSAKPTDVARAILGWPDPARANDLVAAKIATRFLAGSREA